MIDQIDVFLGLVPGTFTAFIGVIVADIVLAADNAVVIGLAASRLPEKMRNRAILYGIIGATVMRIAFALIAVELMQIIGLTLAGGALLLWVAWKFWVDIENDRRARVAGENSDASAKASGKKHKALASVEGPVTMSSAMVKILVADVSMSLENVLAVAGAARDHWEVMVIGLAFSVLLVGGASTFIARILKKYHYLIYIGLAVIIWIALRMMYDGGHEVWEWYNQRG